MKRPIWQKTLMKGIGILFFMLLLISCGSTRDNDCIDESKISTGACTMEYEPVCGCDGETYGNSCQANRAGLTSWKVGECDEA